MKLLYALLITIGVGTIAGIATASSIGNWYEHISKPTFNPPNWLFAPVWTVLYIMMGIALFQIWKQTPSAERSKALTVFAIQLFLNFIWSFIFFNFHQIGLALIVIILLWIFIVITIYKFRQLNKTACYLMVPYLIWVSFATVLNASIFRLN
jgi:benzodiazapine receptor